MITDFLKYKRLFTFGCSHTRHIYPTYADVLAQECSNATFYNLGKAGSGNTLISFRIAEANQRYKFNKDDLLVVMWTTHCREDRFFNGVWQCWGNVYNNNYYDEDFLKKYADSNGYLIKSAASICLGTKFVQSIGCDYLLLESIGNSETETGFDIYDEKYLVDVIKTYDNIWSKYPPYLPTVYKNHPYHSLEDRANGAIYLLKDGTNFIDAHPNALAGYNYLKEIGIPLTDKSFKYAVEQVEILKKCKTQQDILDVHKEYYDNQYKLIKQMFY